MPAQRQMPSEPDSPRLPSALTPLSASPDDLDGASWWQRSLDGVDLAAADGSEAEIEQCRLTRVGLPGARLAGTSLVDVVVEHSDLANAALTGCGLRRVAFGDCRLTGLSFVDGVVRDVVFRDCKTDLANWRATTFTNVHFTRCDLSRADFIGADLRGVVFSGCRLTSAQFSNARMARARLVDCELEGIGGVASLSGATVRSDDLLVLTELFARELGITVETAMG